LKRARKRNRFGTFVFFIPVLAIVALVAFAVLDTLFLSHGTIVVSAVSSGKYSSPKPLTVTATVGSSSETTPFNLSLGEGTYTVVFSSLRWYSTPPSENVAVLPGKISFALGTYEPTVSYVGISGTVFNVTSVTAKHGVTPVVWVNVGSQDAVLESSSFANREIPPGQSYAMVFQDPGDYTFVLFQGKTNLTVQVS
jgi:hypothetical protein